ncbi:MAG: prolipoprotein diacylglyceryl transferase family protein [Elusimicrobiota bacterium]|jgi:phosphatidylglycerol:prolipoprotein diacylglycerol transferase
MLPYLDLGSLHLSVWALGINLGWIAAFLLGLYNAPLRAYPRWTIVILLPWIVLGAFAGAHAFYLLVASPTPFSQLTAREVLNIFSGTAIQGAILGMLAVVAVGSRLARISPLKALDLGAPSFALFQVFNRVGCFGAGCCWGRPAPSWLGLTMTHPASAAPVGIPLYPTQVFDGTLCLVLAGLLHRRLRVAGRPDGELVLLYVLGYALIRFVVQFFRYDFIPRPPLGLSAYHYMALAMASAAGAALWAVRSNAVRRPS